MRIELATTAANQKVDADSGVVYGVSVISEGPALGHGMYCDTRTLHTVKSCAETYKGGLKVKMEHFTDAKDIVGTLRNFRVESQQLRADLFLLKRSPHFGHIVDMAEMIPDQFGLSIAFSCETEELPFQLSDSQFSTRKYARCVEIYSADIVDQPAANPNGLFESIDTTKETMTENQTPAEANETKVELAEASAPVEVSIESLLQEKAKIEEEISALKQDKKNLKSKIEEMAKSLDTPKVELSAKVVEFASKSELEAIKAEISSLRNEFLDAGKLAARQVAAIGIPSSAAPQVAVDTAESVADPKAAARKRAAAALAAINFN
jgi:hypothetical protein